MSDYYQQGVAKAQARDYDGALADFELALIADPANGAVYYRRGWVYFDRGDTLAAVSDFTRSIELQPQQKEAYYGRALARFTLKNFSGALADVDKSIAWGRDFAAGYELKGNVCQKLAQRADGIQAYKLAASLYLQQRDTESSQRCVAKAEALAPRVDGVAVLPNYALAIARAEAGDLWGALQAAEAAVQAHPQDAQAYCCRGVVHRLRDQKELALADFTQALRLDPQLGAAYGQRGKLRQTLGDLPGALADLTTALEIPQGNAEGQTYLWRSRVYAALNNYPGALGDLQQAIDRDDRNPQLYGERAAIQAKLEELAAAQADYQRAADLYLEHQDLPNYQAMVAKVQDLQQIRPNPASSTTTPPPSGGNRELRQHLLRLVGGQWPMAERLIERFKEEYPGYDEDWYLEQTIAYIERGM
jgi:tetratricopeptide (TPR) repeat protein